LITAKTVCHIHFALVHEGIDWPAGHPLELIGHLSKAESLVFLSPDADRLRALTDLRGKRTGIGPSGSGTARLVRQVFAPPHSRGVCPARGHYRTLATLSDRCRRHALSVLVPTGQEFAYRYQAALIADLLYALWAFRDRLDR